MLSLIIMNASDLTEQYLNKLYDDLSKEQQRMLSDMKNTNVSAESGKDKEREITKQLTYLNTLMITTLRLRNLKRQIATKINL